MLALQEGPGPPATATATAVLEASTAAAVTLPREPQAAAADDLVAWPDSALHEPAGLDVWQLWERRQSHEAASTSARLPEPARRPGAGELAPQKRRQRRGGSPAGERGSAAAQPAAKAGERFEPAAAVADGSHSNGAAAARTTPASSYQTSGGRAVQPGGMRQAAHGSNSLVGDAASPSAAQALRFTSSSSNRSLGTRIQDVANTSSSSGSWREDSSGHASGPALLSTARSSGAQQPLRAGTAVPWLIPLRRRRRRFRWTLHRKPWRRRADGADRDAQRPPAAGDSVVRLYVPFDDDALFAGGGSRGSGALPVAPEAAYRWGDAGAWQPARLCTVSAVDGQRMQLLEVCPPRRAQRGNSSADAASLHICLWPAAAGSARSGSGTPRAGQAARAAYGASAAHSSGPAGGASRPDATALQFQLPDCAATGGGSFFLTRQGPQRVLDGPTTLFIDPSLLCGSAASAADRRAALAFARFWRASCRVHRCALAYTTHAPFRAAADWLRDRGQLLPPPDLLVTGDGTRLYLRSQGFLQEDLAYRREAAGGWQPAVVRATVAAVLQRYADASVGYVHSKALQAQPSGAVDRASAADANASEAWLRRVAGRGIAMAVAAPALQCSTSSTAQSSAGGVAARHGREREQNAQRIVLQARTAVAAPLLADLQSELSRRGQHGRCRIQRHDRGSWATLTLTPATSGAGAALRYLRGSCSLAPGRLVVTSADARLLAAAQDAGFPAIAVQADRGDGAAGSSSSPQLRPQVPAAALDRSAAEFVLSALVAASNRLKSTADVGHSYAAH